MRIGESRADRARKRRPPEGLSIPRRLTYKEFAGALCHGSQAIPPRWRIGRADPMLMRAARSHAERDSAASRAAEHSIRLEA